MTHAHNCTLTVSHQAVTILRSDLAAALYRGSGDRTVTEVALADITGVHTIAPTAIDSGSLTLEGAGITIEFPPTSTTALRVFESDLSAALKGNAPAEGAIAGLDFAALAVETIDKEIQIDLATFVDGQLDQSYPNIELSQVQQLARSYPLVAHNAFRAAALLHQKAQTTDSELEFSYGCTLALAREASTRAIINPRDHSLESVATALSDLGGDSVQDTASPAVRTGEVLVGLALRLHHRGSLRELFDSTHFALGSLANDVHRPVLRTDLSEFAKPDTTAATGSGKADTDGATGNDEGESEASPSAQSASSPAQRAPWQAVATPDKVPEANTEADQQHPLFGQHVTLTGEFEPFDKGRLWADIAERGGHIGKNVTKKTTIVVVGEWAKKTSKEKRAEQLQSQGQEISIWPAEKLLEVLGLNEEPPF